MQSPLVSALRDRRPRTRLQWEALLRAEPVTTPLGHPDALVHMIDWTLDEIFSALTNPLTPFAGAHSERDERPVCPCGRNPLLAYFVAGGQAMHEALILAQASLAPLTAEERDGSFHELDSILKRIAHREADAFCGVCLYREEAERRTAGARFNLHAMANANH